MLIHNCIFPILKVFLVFTFKLYEFILFFCPWFFFYGFIIIFITFLGTGLGPWAVGYINDLLEPQYGAEAIRWSLLGILLTCSTGALLFGLAAFTIEKDMLDDAAELS